MNGEITRRTFAFGFHMVTALHRPERRLSGQSPILEGVPARQHRFARTTPDPDALDLASRGETTRGNQLASHRRRSRCALVLEQVLPSSGRGVPPVRTMDRERIQRVVDHCADAAAVMARRSRGLPSRLWWRGVAHRFLLGHGRESRFRQRTGERIGRSPRTTGMILPRQLGTEACARRASPLGPAAQSRNRLT